MLFDCVLALSRYDEMAEIAADKLKAEQQQVRQSKYRSSTSWK